MVSDHIKQYPEFVELEIFVGCGEFICSHIAIVSISETECQCMDCLRKWLKDENFKSDWPNEDRG